MHAEPGMATLDRDVIACDGCGLRVPRRQTYRRHGSVLCPDCADADEQRQEARDEREASEVPA